MIPLNNEPIEKLCVVISNFDLGPFTVLSWYFLYHTMWHTQLITCATHTTMLALPRAKKVSLLFDERLQFAKSLVKYENRFFNLARRTLPNL